MTWLLGIIITQAATFAASLQFEGAPFIPIIAYALVSLLMLIGVSFLLNARSSPGSSQREFNYGSIVFGRWVQATLIVLATISVVASLFGAVPGQRRGRIAFEQELLACSIQAANSQPGGITAYPGSSRKQLDEVSLNRWKSWVGEMRLPADQRMLYVQTEPFDADYLPLQLLIDFDNTGVVFEDAFVLLVENSDANTMAPPIFRVLGKRTSTDIGSSIARQLVLPMRFDQTHLPVFNVPAPNRGDCLVLFVLVKPSASAKVLPPSGDEAMMFLKLKRVN
jgi:hypothetical protein